MEGSRRASLIVLLVVLAGCGGEDTDDETVETSPPSVQSTAPEASPDAEAFDDSALFDDDGDGYFTEGEVRQAIRMTVEDYQWPEPYTPSADVIVYYFSGGRSVEDLEGSLSEVGVEHTVVDGWHECAWYMAWLDAFQNGDSAAQDEALTVMIDVIPNRSSIDSSGEEWLTELARSASLGDPGAVTEAIDGMGCRDRAFDIDEAQG
jgi:hypothetical protein